MSYHELDPGLLGSHAFVPPVLTGTGASKLVNVK